MRARSWVGVPSFLLSYSMGRGCSDGIVNFLGLAKIESAKLEPNHGSPEGGMLGLSNNFLESKKKANRPQKMPERQKKGI